MTSFARALIAWYERAHRDLPWRHTRDPWRILVSEIMLQQTRAVAVIPYYEKLLTRFPTPEALAVASESELLALWAGLGYYSRARNLQRAAQDIARLGSFPRTYDGIRVLPGVGDYTAAAVASIAFSLPHAVLDGNVLRVLARHTGDSGDIGSTTVKRRLQQHAQSLLDPADPAGFNQALMELGATLCTPRKPQCLLCPVRDSCDALRTGRTEQLPIKLRKAAPIAEHRTLLLIRRGDSILLWQRPADSRRLAGFFELPDAAQIPQAKPTGAPLHSFRHTIVNHAYTIELVEAKLSQPPAGFEWFDPAALATLPLSTIARKALRSDSLHLDKSVNNLAII